MKKVKVLIGFLCLFSGYVMAAPAPGEKDVAQAVDHLNKQKFMTKVGQMKFVF